MQVSGPNLGRFVLITQAILLALAIARGARGQDQIVTPSTDPAKEARPPATSESTDSSLKPTSNPLAQEQPKADKVSEGPQIYYVRDDQGRLVPLLGFKYEELQEFLKQKNAADGGTAKASGYGFEQIVIGGKVQGDVAELDAEYKIQLQSADWIKVPLMSGGPVLREAAEFRGSAEHIVQFDDQRGKYSVRLRGAVGTLQQITVKFAVPIKSISGQNQLVMNTPNAAASKLTLQVPQPAIELTGHNGASLAEVKSAGDGSEISCLGLNGPLTLAWKSNSGESRSPSLSLDVTGQILARIDGRHVQFDCRLTVTSLGLQFDKFHIKLPPETELFAVGQQSAAYTLSEVGKPGSRLVEVQLPQRTAGPLEIHLQAERPYDVTKPDQSLELAGFAVSEALPHRQSGQLAVAVDGDWQISWGQQSRVRQIDELVEPLRNKTVVAGFEYFGQPSSLVVRVAPRKTRIIVEPEYQFFVDTHQARLQANLKYAIRGAKTSSLDIAMPGWEIDEIRPASIVDVDSVPGTGGSVSTIQLMQPTVGELELTLKAHRDLPTNAGRVDLPLPAPTADVVGPAILAVLPADNVRFRPRESESQGLSRLAMTPRMKLPVQQQPPLFYRAEQLPAVLVADLERLPQSVSVAVESNMELRRDEIRMEQRFRYKVEHESLNSITLDIPATLASDPDLHFECDGQALSPVMPQSTDPEAPTVTVEVPLSSPRLGEFEVVARYRLAQSPPVGELGSLVTVPLLMPAGAFLSGNSLTAVGDLAPRIQPHDELWTIVDEPQESTGGRPNIRLSASQAASEIALAFTQSDKHNTGATVVQRQWVQTWIAGNVRQDRAAFQLTTSAADLEIDLPPGVSPTESEVRFDRQLLAPSISHSGTLSVKVPTASNGQSHVLELRYQFASGAPHPGSVDVGLPQLGGTVWVQRMYWQLVLPRDEHLIAMPDALTPEFKWTWSGLLWNRQASWSQAELESWVGAATEAALPDTTNQYLFSAAGSPTSIVVRSMARWQIVLAASAIVLGIGLLLIYLPILRRAGPLFVLAVASLAVALWLPDAAVLFSQAAVLGIVLALISGFLHRAISRRRSRGIVVTSKPSSVIERTASPSKSRAPELVGTASTLSAPGATDVSAADQNDE